MELSILGYGPNEFMLAVHGLFFILIVGFASYLWGGIYFTKDPSTAFITRLKLSALVTFVLVLGLMMSGILPDVNFGSGALLSGSYSNPFGYFTGRVTDASVGNFTGPLLFDMMEHVSFVGLALVGVTTYLIWDFGGLVITNRRVKWSVLSIMFVCVAWLLVLGVIGTILTKTLTFPPGG